LVLKDVIGKSSDKLLKLLFNKVDSTPLVF